MCFLFGLYSDLWRGGQLIYVLVLTRVFRLKEAKILKKQQQKIGLNGLKNGVAALDTTTMAQKLWF